MPNAFDEVKDEERIEQPDVQLSDGPEDEEEQEGEEPEAPDIAANVDSGAEPEPEFELDTELGDEDEEIEAPDIAPNISSDEDESKEQSQN